MFIPTRHEKFEVHYMNIVLIDNDELIREIWVYACKKAGLRVHAYSAPEEFQKNIDSYKTNTPIYIDSQLENNIKGEQFALELYNQGFTEIHLTTGFHSDRFENMYWIKSITGKEPPVVQELTAHGY